MMDMLEETPRLGRHAMPLSRGAVQPIKLPHSIKRVMSACNDAAALCFPDVPASAVAQSRKDPCRLESEVQAMMISSWKKGQPPAIGWLL